MPIQKRNYSEKRDVRILCSALASELAGKVGERDVMERLVTGGGWKGKTVQIRSVLVMA